MARSRPGSWRFRPTLNDSPLEARVALARVGAVAAAATALKRPTPAQKIAQEYAAFTADFQAAEAAYLTSIGGSPSGVASATLVQALSPTSGFAVVGDTTDLPLPTSATPMIFSATVGGTVVGLYQAGGVLGTTLTQIQIFDPTQNAFRSLNPATDPTLPVGAVITASVSGPNSGDTDSVAQFQTYVAGRLQTMSQSLITYLNRLPMQLPRSPGPPRRPGPRNAVQLVVFRELVGNTPDSLVNTLGAIPVPTSSSGSDLAFYNATTTLAISTSQDAMLEAFRLTFKSEDALGQGSRIPTIPGRTIYYR